jgi:enoyl-CoA hydratase
MGYENIAVEIDGEIAIVKIDRPESLNAIDSITIEELGDCLRSLLGNGAVRSIILTGQGKIFVAGADISEIKEKDPAAARDFAHKGQALFAFIETMKKPVVAAVNGHALGGGCELAMACDLRIASDRAHFGQPEVKLGLIPGWAGTQRLPRLVGVGKAKEMILTGDPVDAETALRIGLVSTVVPHDDLLEAARRLAKQLASMGPAAIALAKDCIRKSLDSDILTGSEYEAQAFGLCFSTGEPREGISAFFEKRRPNWQSHSKGSE